MEDHPEESAVIKKGTLRSNLRKSPRTKKIPVSAKQPTPKTVKKKSQKPYKIVSILSLPTRQSEEVKPAPFEISMPLPLVVSLEENDSGCFAVKEAPLNGLPDVDSSDSEDDFNSFDEESDSEEEMAPVAKRQRKSLKNSQPEVESSEKKAKPGVRVEFKAKRPPPVEKEPVDPAEKKKKKKYLPGEERIKGPPKKCRFGEKAVFLAEIPAVCLAVHRLLAAGKHDRKEIAQLFDRRKRWVREVLKKTSSITGEMLVPVTRKKHGRKDTLGDKADEAVRRYVAEFKSTNAVDIIQFLKDNNIATLTKSKVRRKLAELGIATIPKPPGPTSARYYRTTLYRKKHPELFPEFRDTDQNNVPPPAQH